MFFYEEVSGTIASFSIMDDNEVRMAVDSDEAMSNDENDIIINEVDGLPNIHPNYLDLQLHHDLPREASNGTRTLDELIHDEDLPTSLIVTNLNSSIFKSEEKKKELQLLFSQFGDPESFQFFRSFRRMRVNYKCPAAAAKTRIHLHQTHFEGSTISCYFAQHIKTDASIVSENEILHLDYFKCKKSDFRCLDLRNKPVSPIDIEDQHLHPPAPVKQFLISPPASPPVGWEPREEAEPLVNYDLLAAIANLTPGEAHELHAPQGSQPGIVVHICEETAAVPQSKSRIVQTRRPDVN